MSSQIKTFIIEEHHEAFIVWKYAIQQGLISPTGNTLFHVDEHSDMGVPRFNISINNLNGDIDKVKDFTYKELGIAGFIVPSAFLKWVNKVYWIRQDHAKKRSLRMFVRSYNRAGKKLIMGKLKSETDLQEQGENPDKKEFKYYLRKIEQIPSKKSVILDIDIDYFSAVSNPNVIEEIYIEITREEFLTFNNNKYHRLNYAGLSKLEAIEKDNKYYYVCNNYEEIYPDKLTVGKDTILDRIKHFSSILESKKVDPQIINICRSRFSGYTPKDQVNFIEENLMNSLHKLYNLDIVNIDDI